VLEEMRSAMSQAKVVTSGILALSRAGGVPLAAVRLDTAVAELRAIMRQVLPPAIDLETDIPPGLEGWSNSAFLQAALLNLALNARDAMPDGGRLSIAARARHWDAADGLAIGSLPAGPCSEITVADNGSGIPPAILSRIFEPLFSTKARRHGHGLGLFMVKEFVLRSGAGLLVDTAPERGTCFRLLMPAPPQPKAHDPMPVAGDTGADTPADSSPLAGLRLLVVDDEPRVRQALARLLAREGVETRLAEHGLAALELLRDDPRFDLVLSDIAMPVLDGPALRERLRAEYPGLPVLLMTGQDTKPATARNDTAGDSALRKPLDLAELRAALRGAIGRAD
jgi:CheY-like chemotaxis protein